MKYKIIYSGDYNKQAVIDELKRFTETLRRDGKTVVNCQYVDAYKVVVFYWDN